MSPFIILDAGIFNSFSLWFIIIIGRVGCFRTAAIEILVIHCCYSILVIWLYLGS